MQMWQQDKRKMLVNNGTGIDIKCHNSCRPIHVHYIKYKLVANLSCLTSQEPTFCNAFVLHCVVKLTVIVITGLMIWIPHIIVYRGVARVHQN